MTAIYQRARPTTFAEVIGQAHVKDVLRAAISTGRAGHAYLFSGPRGVGKTTTARLVAMAANCEREPAERPCGACESCRLVRAGSHPDVIELDAASNNSVEDVRELREKVRLASIRGGSRVWILDEAHMLSRAAANALLKTLEEPPPNLVFVLATTEPEKLPPTILSRCQHFRFRRLTEAEIRSKLERLCAEAGVEAEGEALELVARAADGAMRDAESLLERLLAPGSAITLQGAEDALGLPPVTRMERLASALAAQDLATLFDEAAGLYRDGFAPRTLAERLTETLRDALERDVRGGDGFRVPLERADLLRLVHALDDEQERFVRRDDLYALEVALIKAVNAVARNVPADVAVAPAALGAPAAPPAAPPAAASPARAPQRPAADRAPASAPAAGSADGLPDFDPAGRPPAPRPAAERTGPAAAGGAAAGAGGPPAAAGGAAGAAGGTAGAATGGAARANLNWHTLRTRASAQLKAFLMPASEEIGDGVITLSYGERHRFHHQQLLQREGELEELIESVAGPGWRLVVQGPDGGGRKKA